jgi:hypothetical protein
MPNTDQIDALAKLHGARESIEDKLAEIEAILQVYFYKEFSTAYQHWIPQIKTALRDNLKYLPRGQYTMDYTLYRIEDKIVDHNNKGVTKYI